MRTSEAECLDALRDAAERLGESPTKSQYEELGLMPAASTILRVVGGWNEAKEKAGLSTNASRGSRVAPKPDDVTVPDGEEWADLSQDQRWHYKNVEWNAQRTLERRATLRARVNELKAQRGCVDCGETDPACLDYHHTDSDAKEMAITDMVTRGYSMERIRDEMDDCLVLCANCHLKRHDECPAIVEAGCEPRTKRERLRSWAFEYRRDRGCQRCSEADPVCLQFHHPDSTEKRATVSSLISRSAPESAVREEAEACVVLCANCHRREHAESDSAGDD